MGLDLGDCGHWRIGHRRYPNGLWDKINNRPIVRRGITATPFYDDFEGRPMFMIDCACFGGSSGSPVLHITNGFSRGSSGQILVGTPKLKLFGVLFEGPVLNLEGTIIMRPIPVSKQQPVAVTSVMMNLGHCVKASQLVWFEEEFARREREG